MNFIGSNDCGCGCNDGIGCAPTYPTYQNCNQVVQTYNVQDVPHYVNYNTHVINNCIKRHVNVPTFTQTSENVMINQYVDQMPFFQPMYNQGFHNPNLGYNGYMNNQYQGNVGPNYQQTPFFGNTNQNNFMNN